MEERGGNERVEGEREDRNGGVSGKGRGMSEKRKVDVFQIINSLLNIDRGSVSNTLTLVRDSGQKPERTFQAAAPCVVQRLHCPKKHPASFHLGSHCATPP